MRVSTKRILSIGLAGLFFIGALVTYLNFIQGAMTIVNEKRAKVATQTALFQNQDQAVKQVQSLIEQFKNVTNIQQTASLAIPNGEEAIRALRQIEAIGIASTVKIASIKFQSLPPRSSAQSFLKKLGVLEVDLSARGDYPSLKDFLKKMETTVRIANIKKITFKPAAVRGGSDSLDITVEMYYQI
ncbi:MAG: type 4a pilus biogenesis protein PilO [Candidatus Paceibacterota bacterium]|jgi:Tfp pilus assembly protein PilO